ncbi:HTH_Tnp_Tc3_2 domain-containing protein [Trichonephila clavipes]|nr:HTH_Tnp_Tc3_2 domain-containing protein [Trichonephila clavipes]
MTDGYGCVDWHLLIFSDDSRFCLGGVDKRIAAVCVCGSDAVSSKIQGSLCKVTRLVTIQGFRDAMGGEITSHPVQWEVLVPVDPRDVIHTKTRLRSPSTDQSSKRPPHRKKCTRTTASSAAIQAQIAPSLGAPMSSRTIRRCLAEGHLISRHPLRVLPLTPTHRRLRLEWCEETGLQRNGTRSSLATNPDSITAVMTIVFACGDPVVNTSILSSLYCNTPLPQLV